MGMCVGNGQHVSDVTGYVHGALKDGPDVQITRQESGACHVEQRGRDPCR